MELYIFYCANWYNVIFFMKKMLYSKIISLENIYFEVCKIYYMKDKEHDIYSFFSNIRIFWKKYIIQLYLKNTLLSMNHFVHIIV